MYYDLDDCVGDVDFVERTIAAIRMWLENDRHRSPEARRRRLEAAIASNSQSTRIPSKYLKVYPDSGCPE